jgi:hypothetical protein
MESSAVLTSWEAFTIALEIRFGLTTYKDPAESLTKLRQHSTEEQYQSQLEVLANGIEGLTESFMVSCFLGGLKEDITLSVLLFTNLEILEN